jgi:CRP/FNR family transcriptional regulator, cyclic AMP receptor protein
LETARANFANADTEYYPLAPQSATDNNGLARGGDRRQRLRHQLATGEGDIMILPEGMDHVEFMQSLSPTYANLMAMTMQIKECPPGTVLFREREDCLYIYFVLRGTVSLEIEASPQKTVEIQKLGAGDLLGWSPVLGMGPMTATACTTDSCRIAALAVDRLTALCDGDPRFGMAFMRQMAVTLAQRLKATRFRLCGGSSG